MKSPVAYGAGRFNLKGKKHKLLSCRCCEVINKKEEIIKEIELKEAKDEINDLNYK